MRVACPLNGHRVRCRLKSREGRFKLSLTVTRSQPEFITKSG